MPFIYSLRATFVRILFFLTAIRTNILSDNLQTLNQEALIICPNHSSWLDILLIIAICPKPVCFLGKQEIAKVPLFGWLFKHSDVPVERGSQRAARQLLENAYLKIRQGCHLVIFPEGTVSGNATKLLAFKQGAFKLSIDKQVAIVPLILADAWNVWPYEHFFSGRPGRVRIKILKQIEANEIDSSSALRTEVRNLMQKELLMLFN